MEIAHIALGYHQRIVPTPMDVPMIMKQNEKIPLAIWRMDLLDKAVKTWGIDAQLDMLIEECGELIVAIQHLKRKRVGWDAVAEEIIDVEIMSGQIKMFINNNELLDGIETKKYERLVGRLNAHNKKE